MGKSHKRRRRKRRRDRRKSRSKALVALEPGRPVATRLGLRMGTLEVARGHDGFLRGMPEPTILLGVYCLDTGGTRVVGRYLYRFERPTVIPGKIEPVERSSEECIVVHSRSAGFAIIALAVEEDSGRGLQQLYARLERGDNVVVWSDASDTPTPMHLPEVAQAWLGLDGGRPVHILFGDHDPVRDLEGDDWIAAMIWLVDDRPRKRHGNRLHFVSADTRNDWTATLELTVRRA